MVSDGRTYLGNMQERTDNNVLLTDAFELRVIEGRRPDPSGRGMEVVLQQLPVQEPLCSGGVTMEIYITKIVHFSDLNPADLAAHISFVELAKGNFMRQRAQAAGVELVGRA